MFRDLEQALHLPLHETFDTTSHGRVYIVLHHIVSVNL